MAWLKESWFLLVSVNGNRCLVLVSGCRLQLCTVLDAGKYKKRDTEVIATSHRKFDNAINNQKLIMNSE